MPLAWYSRRDRDTYHICLDCEEWDDDRLEFISEEDAENSRDFELCVSVKCVSHASRRGHRHRRCQAVTSERF